MSPEKREEDKKPEEGKEVDDKVGKGFRKGWREEEVGSVLGRKKEEKEVKKNCKMEGKVRKCLWKRGRRKLKS